jgi:acyl-CoA synthetase (AMP-forming)/AMP-acid ligase II
VKADFRFKGLLRAGLIPFAISPRFSASVIAHLVKESHPGAILVDESTRDLVTQALSEYKSQPSLCTLPSFLSLFPGHNEYIPLPKHDRRPGDISALLHSSSSIANFPKLVPYSSIAVTHHGEINGALRL